MALLVKVAPSNTGLGVFAEVNLPANTKVLQFRGDTLALSLVPTEELNYVLRVTRDSYLIPFTDARYVNHACEPNCYIDDEFHIVTRQALTAGTELTICYNRISEEEAEAWGPFWHPAWSFSCACGTERCSGNITQYIIDEVKPHDYAEATLTKPSLDSGISRSHD